MNDKTLILFDYGGVVALNNRDSASEAMCRLFGVDRIKLRAVLEEKSVLGQAFRNGSISEEEFWEGIVEQVGKDRADLPADRILSRLWSQRYEIDNDVLDLIAALRENCYVGVLTNIDRARDEYLISDLKIQDYFDAHYASWAFRATKQTEELWKAVDERAHDDFGSLDRILFIDDRAAHVESGQKVGWICFRYAGISQLRKDLKTIGFNI